MTSKESLKRIRQETAPATYMQDFDKKECCDTIEKDLDVLEILKNGLSQCNIEIQEAKIFDGSIIGYELWIRQKSNVLYIKLTKEEYQKIKEWLKNEN